MAGLNKEINLPRGVALAVGMVLGSGMLGLPGIVVAAVGSRMAIASWLAVILAMVPMVAIFSRLGSRYTTAAGLTEYARIAFGPGPRMRPPFFCGERMRLAFRHWHGSAAPTCAACSILRNIHGDSYAR